MDKAVSGFEVLKVASEFLGLPTFCHIVPGNPSQIVDCSRQSPVQRERLTFSHELTTEAVSARETAPLDESAAVIRHNSDMSVLGVGSQESEVMSQGSVVT